MQMKDPEWFMIRWFQVYIVGVILTVQRPFIQVTVVKFLDELKVAVSPIEEAYLEDEDAEEYGASRWHLNFKVAGSRNDTIIIGRNTFKNRRNEGRHSPCRQLKM